MAEPISFMLNFPRIQQEQFLPVQPRISQFAGCFFPFFMAFIIIVDNGRHLRPAKQLSCNMIRVISVWAFYPRFSIEIQIHVAVFPIICAFLPVISFLVHTEYIAVHLSITDRKQTVFPIPAEICCICIKQPAPPYARIINICACPVGPFRFCAFRHSRVFKPGNLPANIEVDAPDFCFLEYCTVCFRFLCIHPSRIHQPSNRYGVMITSWFLRIY